ncbi:MAG: AI-2E family transporter [Gemmatimonadota bacterium]
MNQQLVEVVSGSLPLLNNVFGILSGMFLVIFAGFFVAVSPATYRRGMELLVPASHRALAADVLSEIATTLRHWIKGAATAMLIIGVLNAVGLTALGVPAALALGLFAGLMAFIPFLGPVLGMIPALGVALTISPQKALYVFFLYLAIQVVESNLITPLLMKGMVKLEPALTILFQAFMAALFGILGLALAVPLLAILKVLVNRLYVERVANAH